MPSLGAISQQPLRTVLLAERREDTLRNFVTHRSCHQLVRNVSLGPCFQGLILHLFFVSFPGSCSSRVLLPSVAPASCMAGHWNLRTCGLHLLLRTGMAPWHLPRRASLCARDSRTGLRPVDPFASFRDLSRRMSLLGSPLAELHSTDLANGSLEVVLALPRS